MFKTLVVNFKKKSLSERFLLVLRMLFFVLYLVLGITLIVWKSFPIHMETKYRIAMGVLLIVYAILRFFRFFNFNKEDSREI